MKLKLQENITTITFRIDNTDFYVDITQSDTDNTLEAWIYAKDYSKDYLFGIEGSLNSIEEFITMIEHYIPTNNILEKYKNRHM